jgi:hypothetical protein
VDNENALNAKPEKKPFLLELPAKMIAGLSPVRKIIVNMEASVFKSITGLNAIVRLDLLESTAR